VAGFLLRRVLLVVPTLLGVSVIVFALVRLMPGDPVAAMLGVEPSTPAQAELLRRQLGLDQPEYVQYLHFLERLLHGDFGHSIVSHQAVSSLVLQALPMTVELALAALLIALLIALPLGVASAVWRGSVFDAIARVLSITSVAAPTYWIGMLLIYFVAVRLGWLPPSGGGDYNLFETMKIAVTDGNVAPLKSSLTHLALPALTLGFGEAGILTRLVRSSMIDTLGADFVATARSKGIAEVVVVVRHALRNGLIPVVTVLGLQLGALLGGAIVTETLFAWPGMGQLVVNAVYGRDYPIIQATVLMFGIIRVAASLLVDLSYGILDPRVRYS
jgi:ABC-type dipeptide/oligopeptide/nickel transport system permease component